MEDLFSPWHPSKLFCFGAAHLANDKVEFFHSNNLLMAVRVKGACPQLFTVLQGTIHKLIISRIMKKMLFKVLTASAPAIAALTVFMAKIFAASPCVGTYYEPEMPEELKR